MRGGLLFSDFIFMLFITGRICEDVNIFQSKLNYFHQFTFLREIVGTRGTLERAV